MTKCDAIGALMVGGRVVGQVRCDLEAGHDVESWRDPLFGYVSAERYAEINREGNAAFGLDHVEPTPHAMTLTWAPEAEVDLDLFKADEHFDVEIPDAPPTRDIFGVPITPGEPPRHNFGP